MKNNDVCSQCSIFKCKDIITHNEEKDNNDLLVIRQNKGTNEIMKSINDIKFKGRGSAKKENVEKSTEIERIGESFERMLPKSNYILPANVNEVLKIERSIHHYNANVKKIFLYYKYKVSQENNVSVTFDVRELLNLKGVEYRTENIDALEEDLKVLCAIKLDKFNVEVNNNNEPINYRNVEIFKGYKFGYNGKGDRRFITVTGGEWANSLVKAKDLFMLVPSEMFEFNKFEFEIAYTILTRIRAERTNALNQGRNWVNLSIKYLLKDVELSHKYNPKKIGSTKFIKKIENVLNKMQELNWFSWEYQDSKISDLPQRNKMEYYQDFKIIFQLKKKRLEGMIIN